MLVCADGRPVWGASVDLERADGLAVSVAPRLGSARGAALLLYTVLHARALSVDCGCKDGKKARADAVRPSRAWGNLKTAVQERETLTWVGREGARLTVDCDW